MSSVGGQGQGQGEGRPITITVPTCTVPTPGSVEIIPMPPEGPSSPQATSRRDGVLQLLNDSIKNNVISIQDLVDLTLVNAPKKEKVKKTENKRAYHKEWYTRNKQEVLKKMKLNKQLKKCRGVLSQPNPNPYAESSGREVVEGQMKP